MKNIKKLFRQYLPFAQAGVKTELIYKAQIFMWIFISFVEALFVVFLYAAVYRNAPDGMDSVINGFTFYDMVLYMITSFLFSFVMGAGDTSYNIYTDIKEGTIANTLTKPVSYRLRHLFTFLGGFFLEWVVILLPFMVVVYGIFLGLGLLKVSLGAMAVNALFFLLFSVLAGMLNDAISYFVGMMVFYTDHMFGLNMARNTLQGFLGGRMVPLAYMGPVGVVFSFTPFAFLNSVPVLTVMGKLLLNDILLYLGIAVAWLVLIEAVNHLIFRHAMKRLSVQGG